MKQRIKNQLIHNDFGEWTVLYLCAVLIIALMARFAPEGVLGRQAANGGLADAQSARLQEVGACMGAVVTPPEREVIEVYEGQGEGCVLGAGCLRIRDSSVATLPQNDIINAQNNSVTCDNVVYSPVFAPDTAHATHEAATQLAAGSTEGGQGGGVQARQKGGGRASTTMLTEDERAAVELVVMSEAGCESREGQMLVAECILNAAGHDNIGVFEVFERYGYAMRQDLTVTDSVKEAVSAVFDRGERVTDEPVMFFYNPELTSSRWHETLCYVLTEGRHRFFKLW